MCSTNWSNFDHFFLKLIVISNSQLTESATLTLKELGIAEVIQRENLGFDFAAWRDGMTHVGFERLADFDSVTLMNDTCFGSSLGYV